MKNMNPPNTPEIRNIEKYWAKLKFEVKKRSSAAENLVSFKRKLNAAAKAIGRDGVQSLMGSTKNRVRKFSRGEDLD
jgi:site-specific recombinase XerC